MYFIYLLKSEKDAGFYIGFTTRSPQERLVEHQNGIVDSTKHRRPVELIYFEAYQEEGLARERERSLKNFGSAYVGLLKRIGQKL
ncbi:GIY-YIG nuclease family protein [Patescibacteria group bacterium]|nr:GIY-YIG nuclease family protein [Patescibacteria group bacterium]